MVYFVRQVAAQQSGCNLPADIPVMPLFFFPNHSLFFPNLGAFFQGRHVHPCVQSLHRVYQSAYLLLWSTRWTLISPSRLSNELRRSSVTICLFLISSNLGRIISWRRDRMDSLISIIILPFLILLISGRVVRN